MDVGIEIEVDRTVLTEELISVVPVMESTSMFSDSWCEASVPQCPPNRFMGYVRT